MPLSLVSQLIFLQSSFDIAQSHNMPAAKIASIPTSQLRYHTRQRYNLRSFARNLRNLPPEVRNLIYQAALVWNGKTPALLAALRADPMLYQEAMTVFCQINTFCLSDRSKESPMSASAMSKIKKLDIDIL